MTSFSPVVITAVFFLYLLLFVQPAQLSEFCNSTERNKNRKHLLKNEQRRQYDVESFLLERAQNFTVRTVSEAHPINSILFGPMRAISTLSKDIRSRSHPRIVFGEKEWKDLLTHHAESHRIRHNATWSVYFERQTLKLGPLSVVISYLSRLENKGITSLYDGRPFSRGEDYQRYRLQLKPLAMDIMKMNAVHSPCFILCAFWSGVNENLREPILPRRTTDSCIKATVAWSKILLAHRAFYCNPNCPSTENDRLRSFIWNEDIAWKMRNDDYTAGASLALAYDVLHDKMSVLDRKTVRSAIAMLVMNRYCWGLCPFSSNICPNILSEPHKAYELYSMYHSSLFLTNLAIEGEHDFNTYTLDVLNSHHSLGFNSELHSGFMILLESFLKQATYSDGSTVEDGKTFLYGLQESTLALVAAYKRGLNLLDTPRFRNLIYYSSQIIEPWKCGKMPGETSQEVYNSFLALFNFLYPGSEFISILWKKRIGNLMPPSCAKLSWRSVTQLLFFGRDTAIGNHSIEDLSVLARKHYPLTVFYSHRGMLISRTGLGDHDAYMNFDCRADVLLYGRDMGGRGDITFAVGGRTWLKSAGSHSREKSLIHLDGVAQEIISPPARMIRIASKGQNTIAVADLTDAYNIQWARGREPPTRYITIYDDRRRTSRRAAVHFSNLESIGKFGSIEKSSKMRVWKRFIRKEKIHRVVRSVYLFRGSMNSRRDEKGDRSGCLIVSDLVDTGRRPRLVESYLSLSDGTDVDNIRCNGELHEAQCSIKLSYKKKARVVVRVAAQVRLAARYQRFKRGSRIVVSTNETGTLRLWLGISRAGLNELRVKVIKEGALIKYGNVTELLRPGRDGGIDRVSWRHAGALQLGEVVLLNCSSMKPVLLGRQTFEVLTYFRSVSDDNNKDSVTTCHHGTQGRTKISVFECEFENCKQVEGSRKRCSPASSHEEWSQQLEHGKVYFIRIAVESIPGVRTVVELEHFKSRLGGESVYGARRNR